ncbi:hypothetical protein [Kitasatospora sp. NPDC058218]|uniref:hypothetical protein n=1 Tax=Kitasatospora sp. NPDC058218 TaxID=3346385 RepID=UPI0036D832E4
MSRHNPRTRARRLTQPTDDGNRERGNTDRGRRLGRRLARIGILGVVRGAAGTLGSSGVTLVVWWLQHR